MFEGFTPGRTLILDGDGPAYVAAATVKRLDTAIKRFQTAVLARMFVTKSETVSVHLTSSESTKAGRFLINAAKPYQGNRNGKVKPSLLEPLREAMQHREHWLPEFNFVKLHTDIEADDGMMAEAYALGLSGVISSEDKDLRMTPYLYHDLETGSVVGPHGFGFIGLKQLTATQKLVGVGRKFFWAQMMCGDRADHIQGLKTYLGKLCADVGTYMALQDIQHENDVANFVIDQYRAINQNPIPEAWLLYLHRKPVDNVLNYFNELQFSPENTAFIQECLSREWFRR